MVKFLIGVGFTALLLGGLIFTPFFINYSYASELWFGINNLFFLIGGFGLGIMFHREFFTDEIIDPEPEPRKLKKGFMVNPMATPKTFKNDSLGGQNAN